MVGIVIVSHSRQLAEGVAELAREMAGAEARIATAGGLNEPEGAIGTDAMKVMQAIESVYSDDGVLVLMDMGSALLSAEMALDFLSPEQRERVVLCDAPLAEGSIAAAAQARLGSSLAQVMAEARNALSPKQSQLNTTEPVQTQISNRPSSNKQTLRIVVPNKLGFHARPAARIVQALAPFKAEATVSNLTLSKGPANATSINALLTLGVRQGHEIEFSASGDDAQAALNVLSELAKANFGDDDANAADAGIPSITAALHALSLKGIIASRGAAIGVAHFLQAHISTATQQVESTEQAQARLQKALAQTRTAITQTRERMAQQGNRAAAGILDAHLLLLSDASLIDAANRFMFDEGMRALPAWQKSYEAVASQFESLEDSYLRQRAADVRDVGRQVEMHLTQHAAVNTPTPPNTVLIAEDFAPSEVAAIDVNNVVALCAARGAATGHAAVIARSLGLPAVFGLGDALLQVASGTSLIVDGDAGGIIIDPDEATRADYARSIVEQRKRIAQAQASVDQPALTRSGKRIEIAANVGNAEDARKAVTMGAEGVGVFRTEFLFLDRADAPSEDEQYAAYRAVAEAMQRRPVIIRTLDIGGDKPLPYLQTQREDNPFLGLRGLRFCLAHPELFKTQLRAIARVPAEFPIHVMFPMVSTLDEFHAAKRLWEESLSDLSAEGASVAHQVSVGIMVEVPATALMANEFAAEVDFLSIGTNDLTQYVMAAERGNATVAHLNDAMQPAVLKLIGQVCTAAHAHGKWAGVCGEIAGDPRATATLIALGVDELSMSAPAIPLVKQAVRECE